MEISSGNVNNVIHLGISGNSGTIGLQGSSAAIDVTGGSGAGTNDYNKLKHQPSINDVTLIGNKTGPELNLRNHDVNIIYPTEIDDKPQINGYELVGDKKASDLKLLSEGDVETMSNTDIEKILSGMIL